MAAQAAAALVARKPTSVRLIASPLTRTQQSAEPIAAAFRVAIDTDERLIEPFNRFEGRRMDLRSQLRRPEEWRWLSNPLRPSWGEPYREIAVRMLAAITDAADSVESGEVVLVSHQLPIWMVHRTLSRQPLYHDPRRRRCALSSITTLERRDGRLVEVAYADPAAALAKSAVDRGAV